MEVASHLFRVLGVFFFGSISSRCSRCMNNQSSGVGGLVIDETIPPILLVELLGLWPLLQNLVELSVTDVGWGY